MTSLETFKIARNLRPKPSAQSVKSPRNVRIQSQSLPIASVSVDVSTEARNIQSRVDEIVRQFEHDSQLHVDEDPRRSNAMEMISNEETGKRWKACDLLLETRHALSITCDRMEQMISSHNEEMGFNEDDLFQVALESLEGKMIQARQVLSSTSQALQAMHAQNQKAFGMLQEGKEREQSTERQLLERESIVGEYQFENQRLLKQLGQQRTSHSEIADTSQKMLQSAQTLLTRKRAEMKAQYERLSAECACSYRQLNTYKQLLEDREGRIVALTSRVLELERYKEEMESKIESELRASEMAVDTNGDGKRTEKEEIVDIEEKAEIITEKAEVTLLSVSRANLKIDFEAELRCKFEAEKREMQRAIDKYMVEKKELEETIRHMKSVTIRTSQNIAASTSECNLDNEKVMLADRKRLDENAIESVSDLKSARELEPKGIVEDVDLTSFVGRDEAALQSARCKPVLADSASEMHIHCLEQNLSSNKAQEEVSPEDSTSIKSADTALQMMYTSCAVARRHDESCQKIHCRSLKSVRKIQSHSLRDTREIIREKSPQTNISQTKKWTEPDAVSFIHEPLFERRKVGLDGSVPDVVLSDIGEDEAINTCQFGCQVDESIILCGKDGRDGAKNIISTLLKAGNIVSSPLSHTKFDLTEGATFSQALQEQICAQVTSKCPKIFILEAPLCQLLLAVIVRYFDRPSNSRFKPNSVKIMQSDRKKATKPELPEVHCGSPRDDPSMRQNAIRALRPTTRRWPWTADN